MPFQWIVQFDKRAFQLAERNTLIAIRDFGVIGINVKRRGSHERHHSDKKR